MYLTNQFGRVVDHDDPEKIKKLMAAGLRESTQEEIDNMLAKHAEAAAMAAMEKGDGIFYQTVSASPDGYGMSRDLLKKEIFREGIYLSENYTGQKIGLLYSYPYGVRAMRTDVRIIFTMFESDKIPQDWPEYLKLADEVLVPSEWCQSVFKKAGIESTVVHLGYNDEQFYYQDRPVPVENGDPFTFIHYDSFNIRKGFMEVVTAFSEEFKNNEPVRLILKTVHQNSPIPIMKSEYPNIEVIRDRLDEPGLRDLLGRANCMVYPSRGEGFGITPLEAMATGLPAIVPNAHGISAYFDPEYMLEVKATEKTPALYNRFKGQDVGSMVAPDVKDLRAKMRYAYNHQAEMKALGKKASKYVEQFTYKRTAKQLAGILKSWEDRPVQARADSKFLNVEEV
jgi:glycosyltransferase involved in cell wall biosynthesis